MFVYSFAIHHFFQTLVSSQTINYAWLTETDELEISFSISFFVSNTLLTRPRLRLQPFCIPFIQNAHIFIFHYLGFLFLYLLLLNDIFVVFIEHAEVVCRVGLWVKGERVERKSSTSVKLPVTHDPVIRNRSVFNIPRDHLQNAALIVKV